jgi:hypothetical protein
MIVVPIIGALVLLTILGAPFGIVLLTAWMLTLMVSAPVTAYYLGRRLVPHADNALLFMLVGGVVLVVLYLIPILNILAGLVAVVFGLGMIYSWLSRTKIDYKLKAAK